MTETVKKTTTRRRTTATKAKATTAKATATKATETEVVFSNVKDIAEHYFLTSKNVRRLLRQNKSLLNLDEHQKNAIYKFDSKQSEAIKEYFDSKYKKSEAETK